ncbi:hypothetical protein [Staphylococcus sp. HMSC056G08]|uniref:hypothetical protein n=1 Tax=Staphylococcus sp. HMSC056G08 TaxID=1739350 RepID=UPI0008A63488|nr:hypothetical protein [Staphylococcus sp. HMSC056G08]OFJ79625.1 hypothetical protein HMPREF2846_06360 [Staphylococcus sp. HMSC056G08]
MCSGNNNYHNSIHNDIQQGDNSTTNIESNMTNQESKEIEQKILELKQEFISNNKENSIDMIDIFENALKENDEQKAKSIFTGIQELIGSTESILNISDWLTNFFS